MAHVIRGIKQSCGEYQSYKYDNIILHCVCSDDGKMLAGVPVDVVKVKKAAFNDIMNRNKMGLDDFIGCTIRVFYDKYGKPEDFDILEFPETR